MPITGSALKDYTGLKFGMLTAVKLDGVQTWDHGHRYQIWQFRCECGNFVSRKVQFIVAQSRSLEHPPSCGCSHKKGNHILTLQKSIFRVYVKNALARDVEFSLSLEQCIDFFRGDCYYCGCSPSNVRVDKKLGATYLYNGIDRVDNSIGYVLENCVSCCGVCNRMKGVIPLREFLERVKKIYDNENKRT